MLNSIPVFRKFPLSWAQSTELVSFDSEVEWIMWKFNIRLLLTSVTFNCYHNPLFIVMHSRSRILVLRWGPLFEHNAGFWVLHFTSNHNH
jgi:hypothetical protein